MNPLVLLIKIYSFNREQITRSECAGANYLYECNALVPLQTLKHTGFIARNVIMDPTLLPYFADAHILEKGKRTANHVLIPIDSVKNFVLGVKWQVSTCEEEVLPVYLPNDLGSGLAHLLTIRTD